MSKRTQPLTVAEATAAYDRLEVAWRAADDWCQALAGAFTAILDQHTAVGVRLNALVGGMARGEETCRVEIDALWADEAALRLQLQGVMACRRAAAKHRNIVWTQLAKADRAYDRAVARARRAA